MREVGRENCRRTRAVTGRNFDFTPVMNEAVFVNTAGDFENDRESVELRFQRPCRNARRNCLSVNATPRGSVAVVPSEH